MNKYKVLAVTLLSIPFASNAANIISTREENPASVAALLGVPCEKALDVFEKSAGQLLGAIPYVSDARVMSSSDWKEESKTETTIVSTKTINVAVTSTKAGEFPTIFIPVNIKRTQYIPKNGVATGTNTTALSIDGANGIVYQKPLEVTRSQAWVQSFKGDMILVDSSNGACTFTNTFNVVNEDYLFSKRHLFKDVHLKNVQPSMIKGRILNRFVNWAKTILPKMEGK